MDQLFTEMRKKWPDSWQEIPSDVPIGEALAYEMIPFVQWLSNKGFARRTTRRHIDNLWLLGGEIIRLRHQDEVSSHMSARDLLLLYVADDGGPLLYHSEENEQESFDVTCRKLFRWLIKGSDGKA